MERIISKLDYQRLKQRVEQAKTNTRISPVQIMNLLRGVDNATLLDPVRMPSNVVTMHSVVSLEYVDTDRKLAVFLNGYPEHSTAFLQLTYCKKAAIFVGNYCSYGHSHSAAC